MFAVVLGWKDFAQGGGFTVPGLDYLRNLCDSRRVYDLYPGLAP